MGEFADYFLDEVIDYEDWLEDMRQKYPDVPEDQLEDIDDQAR